MSAVTTTKPSLLSGLFCLGPYRYLICTVVVGLVLLRLGRLALVV